MSWRPFSFFLLKKSEKLPPPGDVSPRDLPKRNVHILLTHSNDWNDVSSSRRSLQLVKITGERSVIFFHSDCHPTVWNFEMKSWWTESAHLIPCLQSVNVRLQFRIFFWTNFEKKLNFTPRDVDVFDVHLTGEFIFLAKIYIQKLVCPARAEKESKETRKQIDMRARGVRRHLVRMRNPSFHRGHLMTFDAV